MILYIKIVLVLLGHFLNGMCARITVKTSFSCENRPSGYYADMEAGCQVYHMCDDLGRQFSYSCPNATLFQQRMLICDHWYMVNCNKSEDNFRANLLIGQKNKPFVDESEKNLYLRTPRPDFLTNTQAPKYNVIYKNGRTQSNAFSLVRKNKGLDANSESSTKYSINTFPRLSFTTYSPGGQDEVDIYEQSKEEENKSRKLQDNFSQVNENLKNKKLFNDFQTLKPNTPNEETNPSTFVNEGLQNGLNESPQLSKVSISNRRIDSEYIKQDKSFQKVNILPKKYKHDDKTIRELQQFYLIPNYQFPLETGYRSSYDNGRSSFQNTPNLSVSN